MKTSTLVFSAILATAVHARTDLVGCTKSETVNQWNEASMIWYVPDTGEICDFLDCGGGRAPPKTNTPGCPLYSGTATYEPSYLPGYGPGATATAKTVAETASATTTASSASKTAESSGSKSSMEITPKPTVGTAASTARSTLKTSSAAASNVSEGSASGTGEAASPSQTGNTASSAGYSAYGGLIVAVALAALVL
ncbi:predicted protein [Aspergillus terreus NIH2624]|uniref:Siderophore biosynthesis enzyme n=1 Tax=Aspergillus terreus (strain NIH 2624 / FGSC A1156) TaxID=341663 RepID=Q0CQG1_ASPTN|nr:uncharacterized protein ATEG_04073 [Aspergillus terreus NIH2624]EAU35875.1 predicted protein [Aspergillus terreus NIH2624]